jgi:hypothetical protein
MNNYVDNVYLINMGKDSDRLEKVLKNIKLKKLFLSIPCFTLLSSNVLYTL